MLTDRLRETARAVETLLDQLELEATFTELAAADQALIREAAAAIRSGGADLLATATPHLWAYYREVAECVGVGEYGAPHIPDNGDIWEHVRWSRPPLPSLGDSLFEPSPCYLSFSGAASWEPEHGVQIVFDHTGTICRVSECDGHPTLAHANADVGLLGVIFPLP